MDGQRGSKAHAELQPNDKENPTCKGSATRRGKGYVSSDAKHGASDDRERAASEGLTKKPGGGGSDSGGGRRGSKASARLRVGDKVAARCKGSKTHYLSKSSMDNRGGAHDAKFDAGDYDRATPEGSAMKQGGDGNDSDDGRRGGMASAKLRVGDEADSECKGSKKSYLGEIYSDYYDGTYGTKLDDGDRDRAVPEGLTVPPHSNDSDDEGGNCSARSSRLR